MQQEEQNENERILTPTRHGLYLPPPGKSVQDILAELPQDSRNSILQSFSTDELESLERGDWPFVARREQLPPVGDWRIFAIIAGRGSGKSRAGAEYLTHLHRYGHLSSGRSGIVAPTINDLWEVCVHGESGVLKCAPDDFRPSPHYQRRFLEWPDGSTTALYTSQEPDRFRGPQHQFLWCDEMAAMCSRQDRAAGDADLQYLWDMMWMGLRLGKDPFMMITTTPQPRSLIRKLVEDAKAGDRVAITTGSTYDNAKNLPESYLDELRKYEGTRLGQQEIYARLLDDIEGGLFSRKMIEDNRVAPGDAPEMRRIVVGVDPAASSHGDSDKTGIVIVGLGEDNCLYILADMSTKGPPAQWANQVVRAYRTWNADRIIAEKNNGGEMVEHTMRTLDATLPIKLVHATRGKYVRAEPFSAEMERGKLKLAGTFIELEDQLCKMEPGRMKKSPDSADSAIWACTELAPMNVRRVGVWGKRWH